MRDVPEYLNNNDIKPVDEVVKRLNKKDRKTKIKSQTDMKSNPKRKDIEAYFIESSIPLPTDDFTCYIRAKKSLLEVIYDLDEDTYFIGEKKEVKD